ncbi:MAG: hypothetical protein ACYDH4_12615 [Candidatus Cryosericum sp.]
MADDRHYIGGDNYILDDLSGFKIRASKAKIIPGGITGNLAVSPSRWEPQQPQDFVRGVYDDISVSLARPRQTNRFVIVGTFVTAPSPAQSASITVDSTVGFQSTSLVQIMLDSGVNFQTTIISISGNVMTLLNPLPASVGTLFGDPIENSVLLLQFSSAVGFFVLDSAEGILDVNVLT